MSVTDAAAETAPPAPAGPKRKGGAPKLKAPKKKGTKPGAPAPKPPARFRYQGRSLSGEKKAGVIDALDEAEARERLRGQGIIPEFVAPASAAASFMSTDFSMGRGKKIKTKDMAAVARQLAVTEGSGLSTFVALRLIARDMPDDSPMGIMLRDIIRNLANGESLGEAFGRHEDKIGNLGVALIAAGSASATLDQTLTQWASMTERQVRLKRKIRSAMTYPLAILGIAVAATLASLIFVIPTFEGVYKEFGADLPTLTKMLLAVSHFLKRIILFIPLVPIAAVFGWKKARKDKEIGPKIDRFLLRLPMVGKILHKSVIGRFADVLAVTLRAGVPVLNAIEMSARTAGNKAIYAAISRSKNRYREGQNLPMAFSNEEVIPPTLVALLAQGEATSNPEELLAKFAEMTESEVDAQVTALTELLQPALLLIVFGLVGILGIGIYLPILGLYDQFTA